MIQDVARTFALPGNVILLQNSVEKRRALGTVNGLGASVSSLSRAIGPLVGGWAYALSLEKGVVVLTWFSLTIIACIGAFVSIWMKEGKGFAEVEKEEGEEQQQQQQQRQEGEEADEIRRR